MPLLTPNANAVIALALAGSFTYLPKKKIVCVGSGVQGLHPAATSQYICN